MKKKYHHGDLKNALVETAVLLLESEGLSALSLRRVARETGVSQAAPYSHFKNKRALLAAVASEGYRRFGARMRMEAKTRPAHHTIGLGMGYIFFALDNPALFHLMFDGQLSEHLDLNTLDDEAFDSYQLLKEGVEQHPLGLRDNPYGKPLGTAVAWSIVHGLATLLLNKNFSPQDYGFTEMESFVEHVLSSSLDPTNT
jgi:AcrR family transcriptional regulator